MSGIALFSAAEECIHVYKDVGGGGPFCPPPFQSLGLCLRKIVKVQMEAQCRISKQFRGGSCFRGLCNIQSV